MCVPMEQNGFLPFIYNLDDLPRQIPRIGQALVEALCHERRRLVGGVAGNEVPSLVPSLRDEGVKAVGRGPPYRPLVGGEPARQQLPNLFLGDHLRGIRSEEHTSELQSLMRISSAVFCLKKKNNTTNR